MGKGGKGGGKSVEEESDREALVSATSASSAVGPSFRRSSS